MEKFKARSTVRGKVPRCQYIGQDGEQCERAVYFHGRCFWHQPEAVEQMATIGSKGGKASGKRKARDPEHYAKMVKARKAKRAAQKERT